MSQAPRVWVLTDDRAGHSAQSLGLAHRLAYPYVMRKLRYNKLALLPNTLLGASLKSLRKASRAEFCAPWPELVIAAGRRTVPVMRYIKAQSPETKLVQLMWPHMLDPFDAIIAPAHDTMPDDPRILRTIGSLHAITHATLEQSAQRFAPAFAHLPRPYVAVLVGGSSSHGELSNADVERLCDLSELLIGHGEGGGSLLISTSRRTPAAAQAILRQRLTCPHEIYDWQSGSENPYLGLLGLADAIVVTGDSISMCSEACFTGKPVFTFTPGQLTGAKHKRFLSHLHEAGHAAPLTPESVLRSAPTKPLDEAGEIVTHLRALLAK